MGDRRSKPWPGKRRAVAFLAGGTFAAGVIAGACSSSSPSGSSGASGPPAASASGSVAWGTPSPPVVMTLGRVALESDPGFVGDGGLQACYADALQVRPDQEGTLRYTLTPPDGTGGFRVGVEVASGSLGPELLACASRSLGQFRPRPGDPPGPRTRTASFRPVPTRVAAPPTEAAVRALVERELRAAGDVVRVTAFRTTAVRQHGPPEALLREHAWEADLVFARDGHEATCQHGGVYKVFGVDEHRATAAGHVCTSVRRRAGERTTDASVAIFRASPSGWVRGYEAEPEHLCGDGRCTPATLP